MRVDHPVADTIFLVGYGFFIVCAIHENVHVGFAVWELVYCFSHHLLFQSFTYKTFLYFSIIV